MEIVRELTETELSHLRTLAAKVRSHAQQAQEYRSLLESSVSMILEEEQGLDLEKGVIFEEDALTEEGE